MTVERFLSVKVKYWRKIHLNVKKSFILVSVVLLLVVIINIHLVITIDYDLEKNASILGQCGSGEVYLEWMNVCPLSFFLLKVFSLKNFRSVYGCIQSFHSLSF
jgi:hypothetical protein